MRIIELIDFKSEFWCLTLATLQLNKLNGLWYAFWHVDAEHSPAFLRANGAMYDVIMTPVFTEWFV